MAIEWNTGTLGNYNIQWTSPSFCAHQQKTILIWFEALDLSAETISNLFTNPTPGTNEYWYITKSLTASGRIEFAQNWSTQQGRWYFSSISTNVKYHLAVTYDAGSASNDPIMYLNGESQSITENLTPSGTWYSGTGASYYLGTPLSNTKHLKIYSECYYNRIFSATEIRDAYNSRLAIPSYRGLVFAPDLTKAAGVQAFDGAVLGASNVIRDHVSGAAGVPSGSPIARADNYLVFEGMN